jgi:hypothetical protein
MHNGVLRMLSFVMVVVLALSLGAVSVSANTSGGTT